MEYLEAVLSQWRRSLEPATAGAPRASVRGLGDGATWAVESGAGYTAVQDGRPVFRPWLLLGVEGQGLDKGELA